MYGREKEKDSGEGERVEETRNCVYACVGGGGGERERKRELQRQISDIERDRDVKERMRRRETACVRDGKMMVNSYSERL